MGPLRRFCICTQLNYVDNEVTLRVRHRGDGPPVDWVVAVDSSVVRAAVPSGVLISAGETFAAGAGSAHVAQRHSRTSIRLVMCGSGAWWP